MLSSATKTTNTFPLSQRGIRVQQNRIECLDGMNRGVVVRTVPAGKALFGHVGLPKQLRRSILANAVSPSNVIDTKKAYEGGKVVKVRCSMWVNLCEVELSMVSYVAGSSREHSELFNHRSH